MRFRKLNKEVELPEKSTPNRYINVRASERVDIKPGLAREVETGVEVSVKKDEIASVVGKNVLEEVLEPGGYRPLTVTICNHSDRTMMVYPGQVVASVLLEVISTKETKPEKYKRTTFSSEVTLIREDEPKNVE